MTEKEKFIDYLKKQGFKIADGILMGTLNLIPHHRISKAGKHTLISNITIVNFDGVGTAKGDLGCVCYYYGGTQRKKHHRYVDQSAEILKRVECPKFAVSAITVYEQWRKETAQILDSWKVVL